MLDEQIRFTVALPTFNGARHLPVALRGILAQTEPFDLIVSDDRSNDDTLAIVREMAGDRARISENSEQLGLAGNWNRCVALARTPLIAIFHQDDVMHPGHLAAHRAEFARDETIGLVASAAGVVDDSGQPVPESVIGRGGLGGHDRRFAPGEGLHAMAVENPLRCSAVSLRVAAHRDVGGFDSEYRYVVDWEFWLRVARRWSISWLAAPTVDIRWHGASETSRFRSSTADLDETERLLDGLFVANAPSWPDAVSLRRVADRRLSRAYLNRAYVASCAGNPPLARAALRHAFRLWPGIWRSMATDPRLALRLMALLAIPNRGGRG